MSRLVADDSTYPHTVDAIVDALRHDPILLSPMMGNGQTAAVSAQLHDGLGRAQTPVFVVITGTPSDVHGTDVDQELVSLVHARLKQDGIYVVHTSQGNGAVGTYGDVDPSQTDDATLVSLARFTAEKQVDDAVQSAYGTVEDPHDPHHPVEVPAATEAAVILDIASHATIPDYERPVLDTQQLAELTQAPFLSLGYVSSYDDDAPEPASSGLTAVVAVSVGLVVAVVAYRLLRALRPRRGPTLAPASALDADTLRPGAEKALHALEATLDTDAGVRASGPDLDLALGSRDAARGLIDSVDPLDLVGARVLALTGSRALTGGEPYRCCYLNPTHGEARGEATLGGGVKVPTCRTCRRDVDRGRPLDALREGQGARGRAYYEGDSVWARTGFGSLSDDLWRQVVAR